MDQGAEREYKDGFLGVLIMASSGINAIPLKKASGEV